MSTKKITTVGMLCAMAMIVNVFISFPIVPAVSFLRYDPKDILIVYLWTNDIIINEFYLFDF